MKKEVCVFLAVAGLNNKLCWGCHKYLSTGIAKSCNFVIGKQSKSEIPGTIV